MEQSPELRDLTVAWFDAASRGDEYLLDTHVSRDAEVLLIGSDPSEWFEGSRVTEFLRGEVKAFPGKAKFSPGEPQAFSEGTMGWAVTRPTITLPDGTSVSPRWSAVFRQEDGVWKFVHFHVSFGVSNENVGWVLPS